MADSPGRVMEMVSGALWSLSAPGILSGTADSSTLLLSLPDRAPPSPALILYPEKNSGFWVHSHLTAELPKTW